MAEHEGGFGSGLRAKLAKDQQSEEPRSPAEAIAAAADGSPDVELLRQELSASLAREQALRGSLHEQVEVSGREVRLEQDVAGQAAALDRRAAALAATEAEFEERERQISQRLAELDVALEENERLATLEARISEREQMVDLKVQELKQADDQRAAEANYEFMVNTNGLLSPTRASRFSGDPQVDWGKVMNGYNYVDSINATGAFKDVQDPMTLNRRYGMPNLFQQARNIRLAVRFTF